MASLANYPRQMQTWLLMLMSMLTSVKSQGSVSIPTTDLSPQVGDTFFSLQCNVLNFELGTNRALAWAQDGVLVSWNQEIQGGFNGKVREVNIASQTILYFLDFDQVRATEGGTYKCLIADGQPTSYSELVSAEVIVQVPYFPSEPECSPNVPTIAVIGNPITLSCTSLPGYPDEVTLILQRGSQPLTSGGTVSGNMKQIQYPHTITSSDVGVIFACNMLGSGMYSGMTRTCNIGPLVVVAGLPRIVPTILTKSVGEDAMFSCELSSSGTITWYTEPFTQSTRFISNDMTFTLLNVDLDDDLKQVVCSANINGVVVEDRALLNVNPFVQPPTMPPTTQIPTTTKETMAPVVPVVTSPPVIIMSTAPRTTDTGSVQPSEGIVTESIITDNTEYTPTVTTLPPPASASDQFIIIAIGAVGGLVFILIVVVVAACVCCYSRRPKPIIMTDGNDSDSGDSWDADGAMTRRSRIRVVDHEDNPPPRLPGDHHNYGYDQDMHSRANHLLKIPEDGLSTVRTTSTLSPSLAYALDYLSAPEDPLKDDDMQSTAFTVDSRAAYGMSQFDDDHDIYSQGQTSFREPLPDNHGPAYEEDTGTFVRHYDDVPRQQDPDMPTYAIPHRDRLSKQMNNDIPDRNQVDMYNNRDEHAPDITRNRMSSVPYVNTAFPRNSDGFVENSIYQSADQNQMQYF